MVTAREEIGKAKEYVRQGIDPVTQRKQQKMERSQYTFRNLAEEWHSKQKGEWTHDHAERVLQTLTKDVFPTTTKLALKFLVHTFVRPGEIRGARWIEINIANKEWRIPTERMKMNEEHIVPLSDQAIAILEELRRITGPTKKNF